MKKNYPWLFLVTILLPFSVAANESYWIDQLNKTKDFHFSLKFESIGESSYKIIQPKRLRIIKNKTNQLFQEVPISEAYPAPTPDNERLSIVDINFDGHPDIDVFATTGGAGPNSSSNYYIYNPKTKKFYFNKILSGLTQVEIDDHSKTITSFSRSSCCEHNNETYKWIKGRVTLIGCYYEQINRNTDEMHITTCKYHNGKLTKVTKIEK